MKNLNIPVGVSDFEKIRKNEYYYIDKSGLIEDLLKRTAEVTLITRPRRFGKTLVCWRTSLISEKTVKKYLRDWRSVIIKLFAANG